jgi:hypothetical protein
LKLLEGVDLRPLADKYSVTVWSGDRKNRGWAEFSRPHRADLFDIRTLPSACISAD